MANTSTTQGHAANVIQGPWVKDGSEPYADLRPGGGKNLATVATLGKLLGDALEGKVIGLAYVAFRPGCEYTAQLAGEAADKLTYALGAVEMLKTYVVEQIDD